MSDTTTAPTQTDAVESAAPAKPVLQIVNGNPDDAETAALTVIFAGLAAQAAAEAEQTERNRNMWGNLEERLRRPVTHNPTAFQNVSFY
ncbi:acyl-CoA carboxylase subunit epsilon [Corynebacterium sp. CCM 9185]|uniref:Acyl-CoA carboxylase subunit epsilon n=1 Tax=Corynebacterium marambiense TaxID=2765364 RepID=A0ABS0VY34_9CORY|nr:acyl-CoA carboxylase subunit epsilon [Corynebacterium marambiense]MBI9001687.1 acyl-CoA carboxylase subunit epsilon [Corynebacterium marambiense]MCK7662152.1 acyl-CoA carboxylase subunit epsilon [Corynebacterium marambiense]MCX7541421.1 acyl-CoA carboxylase subunit epsilon [Corynebacterium marambiense]